MRLTIALILLLQFLTPRSGSAVIMIRDSEIEASILSIAKPIFKTAGLPLTPKIRIIQDEDLNAFVTSDATIFINSGLISFSSDPSVLAGVIAHECSHMKNNHVMATRQKMRDMMLPQALTMMFGLLAGLSTQDGGVAIMTVGAGSDMTNRHFLGYILSNEYAADRDAVIYLRSLNTSNLGLVGLLRQLKTEHRITSSSLKSYNIPQTHPGITNRINFLLNHPTYVSGKPDRLLTPAVRHRFALSAAKIDAFTSTPQEALAKYRGSDLRSRYAQAIALFTSHRYKMALEVLAKLIIEEPKNVYFRELQGQFHLKANYIHDAIADYNEALKLSSRPEPLIKFQLAIALLQKETRDSNQKSIELLQQFIASEGNAPIAWHQLAIAYGRNGNRFSEQIMLAREWERNCDKKNKFLKTARALRGKYTEDQFVGSVFRDLVARKCAS